MNFDENHTHYITPQEHTFAFGSSHYGDNLDPYKPMALQEGKIRLDQVKEQREGRKLINHFYGSLLGFPGKGLVVSCEELDSDGRTIRDPRVIGLWNEEEGKVEQVPGRDFDSELKKLLVENGIEYYSRGEKVIEGREGMLR